MRDGFHLIVETASTMVSRLVFLSHQSHPILQFILLAAAALILLPLFGSVDTHPRVKEFLLAACFASVLLGSFATITATIFCIIIVDCLGGVGFNASTVPVPERDTKLAFKLLLEYCQLSSTPSQQPAN